MSGRAWIGSALLLGAACGDDARLCGEGWGMTKDGTCRPLSTLADSDTGLSTDDNTPPQCAWHLTDPGAAAGGGR